VYSAGASGESTGHLEYLLTQGWKVPFDLVTASDILGGALSTRDVLVVPGEIPSDLNLAADEIRSWIEGGGIYVGMDRPSGGGTSFAVDNGYTSSQQSSSSSMDIPGTLFEVSLKQGSPLTLGASDVAYWYHQGEPILSPSTTGVNAGSFPAPGWFSGYATGTQALDGSAAMVDEALGSGRVLLFSSEMNFRAWTDGTAFLLANAIAYPKSAAPAPGLNLASPAARPEIRAAMRSALPGRPSHPFLFRVPSAQTEKAATVLRRFPANVDLERFGQTTLLRVANSRGMDAHSHPFARDLIPALLGAGVDVLYASVT
jgi:hypothetical protein